ncbi:hypothetical protein [Pontibacter sp. G13]|uniref:hypothetical protein n=1 Tax=Pontibacter sp. G13 TaxID=3074898 RepID=UPI00288C1548|nr:hypothetical protein [Pontibacter sp. G13]WNJ20026.1 hypothetical protein RJD25_06040 [Pontibacter sp. G13]
MFWKRPKLPVTPEDQEWIESAFDILLAAFGEERFHQFETITPTKRFFPETFRGTEADAHRMLLQIQRWMGIPDAPIVLEFHQESSVHTDAGDLLTTPADAQGRWSSAAGTFRRSGNQAVISLESAQLQDASGLIATLAHELAHEVLFQYPELPHDHELLTDLTAIFFGFGIFIGNSAFRFRQYQTGLGAGWQMSRTGYLPEPMIAYALIVMSMERGEDPEYIKFLNENLLRYAKQTIKWWAAQG